LTILLIENFNSEGYIQYVSSIE